MRRYIIIAGIFEGVEFNGELSSNNKTIWDTDSVGLGYPVNNCIEIPTPEQLKEWERLNEEDRKLYLLDRNL